MEELTLQQSGSKSFQVLQKAFVFMNLVSFALFRSLKFLFLLSQILEKYFYGNFSYSINTNVLASL